MFDESLVRDFILNGGDKDLLAFIEQQVKKIEESVLTYNVSEGGQFEKFALLKAEAQGARKLLATLFNRITEIKKS